MPKKKKNKGKFKPNRTKSDLAPISSTGASSNKTRQNNKNHGISWYAVQAVVSVAGLLLTTIGGNRLNDISPPLAFVLVIVALCVFLGYWIWVVTSRIDRWRFFRTRKWRVVSVLLIVLATVLTAPYYISYFIKNQGTIEMPTFVDDSTQIQVHYGSAKQAFWTQTTIGKLKQEGSQSPLKINGQSVFTVHVHENRLYVDTMLFAGYGNPPVVIKDNAFSRKPEGWKIYQNSMALEIDNENNIPVLVLEYKSPYSIIISGLFVSPWGIVKVNNEAGSGYVIGDTLAELRTYKVDRLFIHSIFDLFKSERTYTLHD